MNDKKYLDKVLDHMVSRTKIDYDKGEIIFPFTNLSTPYSLSNFLHFYRTPPFSLPFVKYCNRQFGLTNDEVKHVFFNYIEVLKDMYDKHNNNKKI